MSSVRVLVLDFELDSTEDQTTFLASVRQLLDGGLLGRRSGLKVALAPSEAPEPEGPAESTETATEEPEQPSPAVDIRELAKEHGLGQERPLRRKGGRKVPQRTPPPLVRPDRLARMAPPVSLEAAEPEPEVPPPAAAAATISDRIVHLYRSTPGIERHAVAQAIYGNSNQATMIKLSQALGYMVTKGRLIRLGYGKYEAAS